MDGTWKDNDAKGSKELTRKNSFFKRTAIEVPVALNKAIRILQQAAGYRTRGEYLASLLRNENVTMADANKLSDEQFDNLLACLDDVDAGYDKQNAYNLKHRRNQWQKLEESGKLKKYTGRNYL